MHTKSTYTILPASRPSRTNTTASLLCHFETVVPWYGRLVNLLKPCDVILCSKSHKRLHCFMLDLAGGAQQYFWLSQVTRDHTHILRNSERLLCGRNNLRCSIKLAAGC